MRVFSNQQLSIFPSILVGPTRCVLSELLQVDLDFVHLFGYPMQLDWADSLGVVVVAANFDAVGNCCCLNAMLSVEKLCCLFDSC